MKLNPRHTLSTALFTLAACALPAVGQAQVRVAAHLGGERLVRSGDSTALMQLRAEISVNVCSAPCAMSPRTRLRHLALAGAASRIAIAPNRPTAAMAAYAGLLSFIPFSLALRARLECPSGAHEPACSVASARAIA